MGKAIFQAQGSAYQAGEILAVLCILPCLMLPHISIYDVSCFPDSCQLYVYGNASISSLIIKYDCWHLGHPPHGPQDSFRPCVWCKVMPCHSAVHATIARGGPGISSISLLRGYVHGYAARSAQCRLSAVLLLLANESCKHADLQSRGDNCANALLCLQGIAEALFCLHCPVLH